MCVKDMRMPVNCLCMRVKIMCYVCEGFVYM